MLRYGDHFSGLFSGPRAPAISNPTHGGNTLDHVYTPFWDKYKALLRPHSAHQISQLCFCLPIGRNSNGTDRWCRPFSGGQTNQTQPDNCSSSSAVFARARVWDCKGGLVSRWVSMFGVMAFNFPNNLCGHLLATAFLKTRKSFKIHEWGIYWCFLCHRTKCENILNLR